MIQNLYHLYLFGYCNNFVPRGNHLDTKIEASLGTSQGHSDAIALFAELSVDGVQYLG